MHLVNPKQCLPIINREKTRVIFVCLVLQIYRIVFMNKESIDRNEQIAIIHNIIIDNCYKVIAIFILI